MKKLVYLIVLAALLLAGCAQKELAMDMRVVAKAGDIEFTLFDLDCYMLRMNYSDAADELYKKQDFLTQHLEKLLIADAGIKMGLLDSVEVDSGQVSRLLYEAIYRNEVTHKLNVTDKTVRKFWEKFGGQAHLAQIMVNDLNLADSLYDVLKNDPDKFGELAGAFSEDKASRENEGDIGWRRFNDIPYELLDVCFSLKPNEISKPTKSQFGYHLIKFFEKRLNTEEDYEKEKKIYHQQYSLFRRTVLQREFAERVGPQLHFKINRDVLQMLIDKAIKLQEEKFTPDTPMSSCISSSDLTDSEKQSVIAQFDNNEYTADNFLAEFKRQNGKEGANFDKIEFAEYTITMMIMPRLMRQYGYISGVEGTPEFKRQYDDTKIALVYLEVIHDLIDTIAVSDDEVKARYEKTIINFTEQEQIRVWEIQSETKEEAQDILNQLKRGKSFAELAKRTIREGYAEKGGDLGFCSETYNKWAYFRAKGKKEGDYFGPFEKDGKWSVIKIGQIIPKKVKPLSEVEFTVRQMVLGTKKYDIRNNFVEEQKKKVENYINLDLVKETLESGKLKDEN